MIILCLYTACVCKFFVCFFFFFQAEDGIRDKLVTEFRRVLFRSSLLRTCTSLESLRSFTNTRYCSVLGSGAERQNMSLARKLSFFLSSASASGSTYRTK